MLNDNEARAPQWRRLLGEYLAPRLGGAPEAWARANVGAFERSWARFVAPPADPAGFAVEVSAWVGERVRAEIPGASELVRSLAARGLRLHMASGAQSWELEPYLRGMGLRGHFDHLYGPDLVDRYKNGPHYHEAILADSRTDPAVAAAVDDTALVREWASSLGMRSFGSLADLVRALG